ncbi:AEC family transporter [Microbacterium dauci]|uniref:AEC family transporter n=1 Tax=Microbacterium dauci TaxID=3048008 RepID=A0ABT6ZDI5_9MICO|nr:AEC family transporter [Microbacterium sp. LX3-4]MDJ1113702.1 AEC family transporter [Microbacterium sp. LX3-4]
MLDVLTGFVVIGVAILVGWIIGRIDLLGPNAGPILGRLTFFVLSPFLLFVVLSEADVAMLFSGLLPVSALTAVVIFIVYALPARLLWKRRTGDIVIGALASGQVNSNNIGIPLSLYVLGSAAFPAPVILFQLLILTPIVMAILDAATTTGSRRPWPILKRTITNPIVLGSALGTAVAALGIDLPPIVVDPLHLLANAAVPVLLISYGISLNGQRVLGPSGRRRDIILASGLKLFAMPLVAWALAAFVFRLSATEILVVTVLAALPTAQNVFNYAQRYQTGETIARDTVFITTVGCVPVLFLVVLLLSPVS